jgi:hypothetical protein
MLLGVALKAITDPMPIKSAFGEQWVGGWWLLCQQREF